MKHSDGRCLSCGERLFAHVDGGYACHNCGARHLLEPLGGRSAERSGLECHPPV
jgi:DNA-directed RNA polymerase subunit RPC12/RpoP